MDSPEDALVRLVDRVEWYLEAPPERRDLREAQLRDAYRSYLAAIAPSFAREDIRPGKQIRPKGPTCPGCRKGYLVARSGAFGDFAGCSTWPTCRYTRSGLGALDRWRATQRSDV